VYDEIFLQAAARSFHEHLDDEVLDGIARDAGCEPLGRLSILDDDALADLIARCGVHTGSAVLDLGCGRGFLGRSLIARGIEARYTGVDRIGDALNAARRHVPGGTFTQGNFRRLRWNREFDAVFALEVVIDGALDAPLIEAVASALRPGGRAAITVASFDGAHARRLSEAQRLAAEHFASASIEDWTERTIPFARKFYGAFLACDSWHPEIVERCHAEARAALAAIERGTFHYAVVFATG
jgi:trans-aconitate methyltransferase